MGAAPAEIVTTVTYCPVSYDKGYYPGHPLSKRPAYVEIRQPNLGPISLRSKEQALRVAAEIIKEAEKLQ